MTNIIPFPRAVIIEEKIRRAERQIEKQLGFIENCSLTGPSVEERVKAVTAPQALEWAQEDLRKALAEREMLSSTDIMRHCGMVYRAQPSQNGAH